MAWRMNERVLADRRRVILTIRCHDSNWALRLVQRVLFSNTNRLISTNLSNIFMLYHALDPAMPDRPSSSSILPSTFPILTLDSPFLDTYGDTIAMMIIFSTIGLIVMVPCWAYLRRIQEREQSLEYGVMEYSEMNPPSSNVGRYSKPSSTMPRV